MASFTAAIVLIVIGAVAMSYASGKDWLLGLLPFLFGVQQGFEGLVWLGVTDVVTSFVQIAGAYGFLAFAICLWPTIFAVTAYLLEETTTRRSGMQWTAGIGFVWTGIAGAVLLLSAVNPIAYNNHLLYNLVSFPLWVKASATLVYAGIGLIPLFLSSHQALRVLGWLLLVSGVTTRVLAAQHFVSVWCFWAAIISSYIAYIVYTRAS